MTSPVSSKSKLRLSALAATLAAVVALPSAAMADLTGSWSGSGSIMLPSGAREAARCNVSYRKSSGLGYTAFATCATKSAKVTQSAQLRRTGGNEYEGSFYNNEYNISGSMSVTVSGSRQAVHLSGGGGQASFRLSRR